MLQVLPATSSDLMSRERELISAQHDATRFSSGQQVSGNSDSVDHPKPASFLSIDHGSAVGKLGSFSSYNKVQDVSSFASTAQEQQLGASVSANWGPPSMSSMDRSQNLAGMQSSGGRHTHND